MVVKCVGVIRCVWGHFLVDSQSKAVQGGLDSSADLSVFLDVVHSGCLLDREWVEGTSFWVWHKEMLRCMSDVQNSGCVVGVALENVRRGAVCEKFIKWCVMADYNVAVF